MSEGGGRRQPKIAPRLCPSCDTTYVPNSASQKFCTPVCRPRKKQVYQRSCQRCGDEFQAASPNAKFCSGKCRRRTPDCCQAPECLRAPDKGQYCSPHYQQMRKGKAFTPIKVMGPRGEGFLKDGYRVIAKHLVHRVVKGEAIGRELYSDETVHHKNGDKDDNRDSNLELWSSRHPRGQRILDKIEYAWEILEEYAWGLPEEVLLDMIRSEVPDEPS